MASTAAKVAAPAAIAGHHRHLNMFICFPSVHGEAATLMAPPRRRFTSIPVGFGGGRGLTSGRKALRTNDCCARLLAYFRRKNQAAFRRLSQRGRRTRRFDRGIWKHPSLPKGSRISMTTELAGKTTLITGAGRGTGPAPARRDDGPAAPGLDPDSARWLQALADDGPRREPALAELYAMLLRAARREAARRGPRAQITGPEPRCQDKHHRPFGNFK